MYQEAFIYQDPHQVIAKSQDTQKLKLWLQY